MDFVDYANLFIGVPYKWGGQHPAEGYDCSGFVQEVLASRGLDPSGDQTADMLFKKLVDEEGYVSPDTIKRNDVLFFGSANRYTHVAIAIDDKFMVEAGGGGRDTKTIKDAVRDEAMVRIRPVRLDLKAVIRLPEQITMDI